MNNVVLISIVKKNVKRDGILECDYSLVMAMPRVREYPDKVPTVSYIQRVVVSHLTNLGR